METKKLLDFLLKKSGLKQAEIAKKMDVTPVTVHRWITGDREPTYQNVVKFCNVCGYSLLKALKEFELENENHHMMHKDSSADKCVNGASITRFKFQNDELGEEALFRYFSHCNDPDFILDSDVLITKKQFIECYNRWIKGE